MEIGSEYDLSFNDLNVSDNNVFSFLSDFNCIYTDSGRSAIRMISKRYNHALLPEFICESVINCFTSCSFYSIDNSGDFDLNQIEQIIKSEKCDVILLAYYFGHLPDIDTRLKVRRLADILDIEVIEDFTQSIFSIDQIIGDYCICSLRKWFPIPLGGVLFSHNQLPDSCKYSKTGCNDRAYAMIMKNLFLNEQLDCNAEYRELFVKCEEALDEQKDIMLLSDFSRFLVSCFDVGEIIDRRRNNYSYLKMKLSELGVYPVFTIEDKECPFTFVLRIPNRDAFRRYLIENKVYCAVHWPFDGIKKEEREMAIRNSNELISLPIDQRYNENDMDYLVDVIGKYEGSLKF